MSKSHISPGRILLVTMLDTPVDLSYRRPQLWRSIAKAVMNCIPALNVVPYVVNIEI